MFKLVYKSNGDLKYFKPGSKGKNCANSLAARDERIFAKKGEMENLRYFLIGVIYH